MSELVYEARVPCNVPTNPPEVGAPHTHTGDVVQVNCVNARGLLVAAKRGSGFFRLSTATDTVRPAPKFPSPPTLGQVRQSIGPRHDDPIRLEAQRLSLETLPVEGKTWLEVALERELEKLQAEYARQYEIGQAALDEARKLPASLEEVALQKAEAEAVAARDRMRKAKKIADVKTIEELQGAVQEAGEQVRLFEQVGVDPAKLDGARAKSAAAQKELADRFTAHERSAAESALQPALAEYDKCFYEKERRMQTDPIEMVVQPAARVWVNENSAHIDAAKAALAADNFGEVHRLAKLILEPAQAPSGTFGKAF